MGKGQMQAMRNGGNVSCLTMIVGGQRHIISQQTMFKQEKHYDQAFFQGLPLPPGD